MRVHLEHEIVYFTPRLAVLQILELLFDGPLMDYGRLRTIQCPWCVLHIVPVRLNCLVLLNNFRLRFLLELHEFLCVDVVVVRPIKVVQFLLERAAFGGHRVEHSHYLGWCKVFLTLNLLLLPQLLHHDLKIRLLVFHVFCFIFVRFCWAACQLAGGTKALRRHRTLLDNVAWNFIGGLALHLISTFHSCTALDTQGISLTSGGFERRYIPVHLACFHTLV